MNPKLLAAFLLAGLLPAQTPHKPKLVVTVVVDQFRFDYLTRFRSEYHGGFDRMMRGGAVYANARYGQSPTVTAVGHSIVTTGAMPAVSGIVNNVWFDRESKRQVTSVCDDRYKLVGAETPAPGPRCDDGDAASPHRLLVSSIGDELKNRDEHAKVFGISLKSRSAILPSGHRADGAFWFDDRTGTFITSDYYGAELPAWVREFNAQELARNYVDRKWDGFPEWDFHADASSPRPYERIPASPWGNELIELLAEKAIVSEQLGQRDATDLLTVSFSSNDYVGHQVGPDAPEVRDLAIRTDKLLGKLIDLVAQRVGIENAVFVLSADHGVAPAPEVQEKRKLPGGYIFVDIEDIVRAALSHKFGADLVLGSVDTSIYLDRNAIAGKNLDPVAVSRVAADALMAVPQAHVARVFLREDLERGLAGDAVAAAVGNGYHAGRSGDILVVFEPYWMGAMKAPTKTTHFAPYLYDMHVPVVFFGAGIRPGWYRRNILVNDIAPTLAALMDVETPSGAFGDVLGEVVGETR